MNRNHRLAGEGESLSEMGGSKLARRWTSERKSQTKVRSALKTYQGPNPPGAV